MQGGKKDDLESRTVASWTAWPLCPGFKFTELVTRYAPYYQYPTDWEVSWEESCSERRGIRIQRFSHRRNMFYSWFSERMLGLNYTFQFLLSLQYANPTSHWKMVLKWRRLSWYYSCSTDWVFMLGGGVGGDNVEKKKRDGSSSLKGPGNQWLKDSSLGLEVWN